MCEVPQDCFPMETATVLKESYFTTAYLQLTAELLNDAEMCILFFNKGIKGKAKHKLDRPFTLCLMIISPLLTQWLSVIYS